MTHRNIASKKDATHATCRPRRSAKPTSYGTRAAGSLLYKPAGVLTPLALRADLMLLLYTPVAVAVPAWSPTTRGSLSPPPSASQLYKPAGEPTPLAFGAELGFLEYPVSDATEEKGDTAFRV